MILAKYMTALVITFADDSRVGYAFPSHAACEAGMEDSLQLAEGHGDIKIRTVQCVDTDQITVSPRPKKKPKGLK